MKHCSDYEKLKTTVYPLRCPAVNILYGKEIMLKN